MKLANKKTPAGQAEFLLPGMTVNKRLAASRPATRSQKGGLAGFAKVGAGTAEDKQARKLKHREKDEQEGGVRTRKNSTTGLCPGLKKEIRWKGDGREWSGIRR